MEGSLALYDLSSSYFEGTHCLLAKIGHDRDGQKNKLQVTYWLPTNQAGCPVAVSVHEGNTGDAKALMPQVKKLRTHKHQALLEATEKELEKVPERVSNGGRLKGEGTAIGVRIGRVLKKHNVGRHFSLEITDTRFAFHRLQEQIAPRRPSMGSTSSAPRGPRSGCQRPMGSGTTRRSRTSSAPSGR